MQSFYKTVFLFGAISASPLFAQGVQSIPIESTEAQLNSGQPILARQAPSLNLLPDAPQPQLVSPGAQTVSAEELRHPLSRKGRSLLEEAQKYADKGDHVKAVEALHLALKEPSAAPYAHGVLGTEYLKLNRLPDAISELNAAKALLPRLASNLSNLGYALCKAGDIEQGAHEIEEALALEPSLVKARFLKGVLLLDRGDRDDRETWQDLSLVQNDLPTAHLALAIYYGREGQPAAARKQLEDYSQQGLGVSVEQAQIWLDRTIAFHVSPAQALGLWTEARQSAQVADPGR